LDQRYEKEIKEFASLRNKWEIGNAMEFNDDSEYKKRICAAIDFKHECILELGKLVYHEDKLDKDNFVRVATSGGHVELSKTLLSLGFPLCAPDNINDKSCSMGETKGETLLATSCRLGNFEVFEKLLTAKADVNVVRHDGTSALQLAIASGNDKSLEMLKALLEAKADVNVINGAGASVLHCLAMVSGNARSFNMLDALLPAGADLNLDLQDSKGETPLATACRMGNFEVFEKLLTAKADVNVVRDDSKSALQLAIVSGNARIVEMFLARQQTKADVKVINGAGASVLHCLAIFLDNDRSSDMFEALLKNGADLELNVKLKAPFLDVRDSKGETPLATACRMGNFEIFGKLLTAKADVNVLRDDGKSALQLAIVTGNDRILNRMNRINKIIEFDERTDSSYVHRLSQAFLQTSNICGWLKGGWSPYKLIDLVDALLSSAAADRTMQDRLSHVRAFLNQHSTLLKDPSPLSPLTMDHVVEQLAFQEHNVFEGMCTAPTADAATKSTAFVELVNKLNKKSSSSVKKRPRAAVCGEVRSVVYSPDASRLARVEGNEVVVCDAVNGKQVCRLKGHE
jgi:ankyrin repeat protein